MSDHLTAQHMLTYLDGELSRAQRYKVKAHLESCWTCRSEIEHLKSDIAIILDAQREVFAPALADPPRRWATLEALAARSESADSNTGWLQLRVFWYNLLNSASILAISAVIVLLAIGTYSLWPSQRVSAKEVLQQIRAADVQRSMIGSGQVIRQRIHVCRRVSGQGALTTASMDAWRSRSATYWNVSEGNSAAAALRAEYQSHGIPEGLPLSALAVDSWARMTGREPVLWQQGSDMGLTFVGASRGSNSVQRVRLLIQPQTWHVLEMMLEFTDASFEIREDDFAVMAMTAVPPTLLAYLEPGFTLHASPNLVKAKVIRLPQQDVDRAELRVLFKLHQLNADLGEPVTVTHSPRGVQVTLWQLTPSRKDELRAALAGEPGVSLGLTPPRGSPKILHIVSTTRATSVNGTPPEADSESNPEDRRLLKFFGSAEKKREFSRDALATSTLMVSHAYALRNLEQQFSVLRERTLTFEQQAQLHQLIDDHLSAIASTSDSLETQLEPLDESFHVAEDTPSDLQRETDWRQQTQHTLESARSIDHLLRAMLTTSEAPASAEIALPQISQNLAALRLGLRRLNGTQH